MSVLHATEESTGPVSSANRSQKNNTVPAGQKRTQVMSRTTLNFWLDLFMLVVFLGMLFVAAVVHTIFPAGSAAEGWILWGWSFDQWSQLEFGLICLFALSVLVHLILHWNWLCSVASKLAGRRKKVKSDDPTRTLIGVGILILVLNVMGLAIAAAVITIQSPV